MRHDLFAKVARNAGSEHELALEPAGHERERRPDVADDFGVREKYLLDVGRRVADMNHLEAAGAPMKNGGFAIDVVADRDDQVGAVHPFSCMVVARRKRGGAHVEVRAAGDGALAHLRIEERDAGALHEAR